MSAPPSQPPPPYSNPPPSYPAPPLLSPCTSPEQGENLDAPDWLGRPGYESRTQRWFELQEQFSADVEMEDCPPTNQFSDIIRSASEQNFAVDELEDHVCGSKMKEQLSQLEIDWEMTAEEAEVPHPFYLSRTTSPQMSVDSIKREIEAATVRNAELEPQIRVLQDQKDAYSRSTSASDHSSPQAGFYPFCFTFPAPASQDSRPSTPSTGRESHHLRDHTMLSEAQQLVLLSEQQMHSEYKDLLRGPISNEEFTNRLRELDEHWRIPGFCSEPKMEGLAKDHPIWYWYSKYCEEFPDRAKELTCATDEECESLALEIQDEYFQCETDAYNIFYRAFEKFSNAGEGVDYRLIAVARDINFLIKGKFHEDLTLEGYNIPMPSFDEEEGKSANRRLARELIWVYELNEEFFEGRYPLWLLAVVRDLVDVGTLEEGQSKDDFVDLVNGEWTVWPGSVPERLV